MSRWTEWQHFPAEALDDPAFNVPRSLDDALTYLDNENRPHIAEVVQKAREEIAELRSAEIDLQRVLYCFGAEEGTWYEYTWRTYGISEEAQERINRRHDELDTQGVFTETPLP